VTANTDVVDGDKPVTVINPVLLIATDPPAVALADQM
jgi:hypothetical protein